MRLKEGRFPNRPQRRTGYRRSLMPVAASLCEAWERGNEM